MLTVKSFTFNPVQENTYVLYDEKDACAIIDPGCYFGNERRELETFIEEEGLVPKWLLNTHCHLDHVFGNKFINERYGLTLHIHPLEEQVLLRAPEAGLNWGMPFENYRGPLAFLNEGDKIRLNEDELTIILAPGHSPGSICFYSVAQHFLIGGDVLFRGSIGRTDLPGGNHQALLDNISQKLFKLPDDVVVYPGHGEPTTIGFEKKHNPFLQGLV